MRNTVAIVLALSLLASPALATTEKEAELQAQVDACEEALDLADVAINKQAETITQLDQQNQRLQRALDYQISETASAKASSEAWYRKPSIVAPLAAVLGFVAGAYVSKR